MWYRSVALGWVLILAGCASQPAGPVPPSPAQVAADESLHAGQEVTWAAVVIASENRRDSSWLELLAYPMDGRQRPVLDEPSQGRFMAWSKGYLETRDFRPGRSVTVKGNFRGLRRGQVGQGDYLFPTLEIQDLWLWPVESRRVEPQIHFGIGVGVGF